MANRSGSGKRKKTRKSSGQSITNGSGGSGSHLGIGARQLLRSPSPASFDEPSPSPSSSSPGSSPSFHGAITAGTHAVAVVPSIIDSSSSRKLRPPGYGHQRQSSFLQVATATITSGSGSGGDVARGAALSEISEVPDESSQSRTRREPDAPPGLADWGAVGDAAAAAATVPTSNPSSNKDISTSPLPTPARTASFIQLEYSPAEDDAEHSGQVSGLPTPDEADDDGNDDTLSYFATNLAAYVDSGLVPGGAMALADSVSTAHPSMQAREERHANPFVDMASPVPVAMHDGDGMVTSRSFHGSIHSGDSMPSIKDMDVDVPPSSRQEPAASSSLSVSPRSGVRKKQLEGEAEEGNAAARSALLGAPSALSSRPHPGTRHDSGFSPVPLTPRSPTSQNESTVRGQSYADDGYLDSRAISSASQATLLADPPNQGEIDAVDRDRRHLYPPLTSAYRPDELRAKSFWSATTASEVGGMPSPAPASNQAKRWTFPLRWRNISPRLAEEGQTGNSRATFAPGPGIVPQSTLPPIDSPPSSLIDTDSSSSIDPQDKSSRRRARIQPAYHATRYRLLFLLSTMLIFGYGLLGLLYTTLAWSQSWARAGALVALNRSTLVAITFLGALFVGTAWLGIAALASASAACAGAYLLLLWPCFLTLAIVAYALQRALLLLPDDVPRAWRTDLPESDKAVLQALFACCGFASPGDDPARDSECAAAAADGKGGGETPGCQSAMMQFQEENLRRLWLAATVLTCLFLVIMVVGSVSASRMMFIFGSGGGIFGGKRKGARQEPGGRLVKDREGDRASMGTLHEALEPRDGYTSFPDPTFNRYSWRYTQNPYNGGDVTLGKGDELEEEQSPPGYHAAGLHTAPSDGDDGNIDGLSGPLAGIQGMQIPNSLLAGSSESDSRSSSGDGAHWAENGKKGYGQHPRATSSGIVYHNSVGGYGVGSGSVGGAGGGTIRRISPGNAEAEIDGLPPPQGSYEEEGRRRTADADYFSAMHH